MPLSGNDKPAFKIFFFISILTFLTSVNAFSQTKDLTAQEEKLADLYSTMVSFFYTDKDSLELYAKKFEKEFKGFIKSNPGTLQYDFKKLGEEENICQIQTSSDGNLRIYNWDTENSGPVHYHKSIYQWRSNGKVFTNIGGGDEDVDGGDVCANLYTVKIDNKVHYLVIKRSVGSGRDQGESISAYRIDGEKLIDTVKVFKTKTETLNSIIVNTDNFNVVDDYNQDEGITYDAQKKIVSIPLVNENNALTNNYLLYKLKGRYFEYVGTNAFVQTKKLAVQEPDRRHVLFEDVKTKFQSNVTNQCDTIKTHLNDNATKERIAFLNKDFSTDLFSKNNSVAYWYCNTYDSDNKMIHFEIVSILFKTDKDRDAALKKIKSAGRTSLIIKVLTRFKVKTFEKELIIAYSETSKHKVLAPFWDKLFD